MLSFELQEVNQKKGFNRGYPLGRKWDLPNRRPTDEPATVRHV